MAKVDCTGSTPNGQKCYVLCTNTLWKGKFNRIGPDNIFKQSFILLSLKLFKISSQIRDISLLILMKLFIGVRKGKNYFEAFAIFVTPVDILWTVGVG